VVQTFYRICFSLRRLPWQSRLLITLVLFCIPEALVAYLAQTRSDQGVANLLLISGIVAVLCFSWKRALAIEWSLLLVYIGIDFAIKGPTSLQVTAFFSGTFFDFFITSTIGLLRHAWEVAEDNRILAEENTRKEQKLNENKDQFVLLVNHELRNPLGIAYGALDILDEEGEETLRLRIHTDNAVCDYRFRLAFEKKRSAS